MAKTIVRPEVLVFLRRVRRRDYLAANVIVDYLTTHDLPLAKEARRLQDDTHKGIEAWERVPLAEIKGPRSRHELIGSWKRAFCRDLAALFGQVTTVDKAKREASMTPQHRARERVNLAQLRLNEIDAEIEKLIKRRKKYARIMSANYWRAHPELDRNKVDPD